MNNLMKNLMNNLMNNFTCNLRPNSLLDFERIDSICNSRVKKFASICNELIFYFKFHDLRETIRDIQFASKQNLPNWQPWSKLLLFEKTLAVAFHIIINYNLRSKHILRSGFG